MISLIVAMSRNHVIGKDNALPWVLPNDQRYFRTITEGHPVIMGRKTFDSIGRLLPKRTNIVITRNHQEDAQKKGATVADSLDDAIKKATKEQPQEIFIIGGGEVYRQAMPMADKLYITRVDVECDGDAFFPNFEDSGEWREISATQHLADADHAFAYTFLLYERI